MQAKIAINGFGRIGRMVFRKLMTTPQAGQLVAINASYPAETLAHLIKYDSVHGRFDLNIEAEEDALIIEGQRIQLLSERNPSQLPWDKLDVDVVIEATGKFHDRAGASQHLQSGARKVVLTAPGKNEDITIVMGVNEQEYRDEEHHIISNASCTTNCLAPLVKVLDDAFGLKQGMMTTIHSFTNDQQNLDNPHKDLRRARACGQSIIPTSTGAAKTVTVVLPHLKGKLNGISLRVPTPDVSIVDLVAELKQDVDIDIVNKALREASENSMSAILEYTAEPLVSADFIGNPHSTIVDGLSTMVMGDRQVKVLAWYDNEWGYSCRVVDLVQHVGNLMKKNEKHQGAAMV